MNARNIHDIPAALFHILLFNLVKVYHLLFKFVHIRELCFIRNPTTIFADLCILLRG